MVELFETNSYRILGLDATASQKDIAKRGREIINLLKIGESPEYDFDILFKHTDRTEEQIKNSLEKLSTPDKKIGEKYFWFDIVDDVDKKAIEYLKGNNYLETNKCWTDGIERYPNNSFRYRKNLAILYSILLSKYGEKELLNVSLGWWKEVIINLKDWESFVEGYKIHDELDTRSDIYLHWKDNALFHLADFYADLYKKFEDPEYYKKFYETFKIKGKKIDIILLSQKISSINERLTNIEKIKAGDLSYIKSIGYPQIKKEIGKIEEDLSELKKFGLYDSSEVKVLRDRCAESLRQISIFLHNQHKLLNESQYLVQCALRISGTRSLSETINQDIAIIEKSKIYEENKPIFDHISTLLQTGEFDKAKIILDSELNKKNLPPELRQIYEKMRHDVDYYPKIRGKSIDRAPTLFTFNGIGATIYGDTHYFVILYIPILPLGRYSLEKSGDNSFIFFGRLDLHPWQRIWQYIFIVIVGYWIFGFWIILLLIIWFMYLKITNKSFI